MRSPCRSLPKYTRNCAVVTEPRVLAIIPAAGQSRRLGRPKQLIEYRGKTLLDRCVDNARAVCDDLLVVTGAYRERIIAALSPATPTLHNPHWRDGLGTTLACAVSRAAASGYDAVLVLLPDQPRITTDDLQRLLAEFRAQPERVVCSAYAGTYGVPAILPSRLFGKLRELNADRGAHELIAAESGIGVVPIATAAIDIDTPADLAQLQS